uniref:Ricin B-type lectin domain-containing protein n=1 Tax=Ascaris lumbricoides TaxID=6252 RepID=A0A0M3HTE2_ASCLU
MWDGWDGPVHFTMLPCAQQTCFTVFCEKDVQFDDKWIVVFVFSGRWLMIEAISRGEHCVNHEENKYNGAVIASDACGVHDDYERRLFTKLLF